MKSVALSASPRSVLKRTAVKKIRKQGFVPAVIYGRIAQPRSLQIATKELETLIKHAHSENLLIDLKVEEKTHLALVQEIQHHPMTRKILHVDLHEVAEDEKVTITVAVDPVGEAIGVKAEAGTLEHVLHKIKVRALPRNLPEVIHVDVSHLKVGQAIHLGEIKLPEGVEALGKKETSVFSVAAPVTEAQEAAAAAAAGTGEVEMIKEKKEDGATAAPAAKADAKGAAKADDKKPAAAAEKKK